MLARKTMHSKWERETGRKQYEPNWKKKNRFIEFQQSTTHYSILLNPSCKFGDAVLQSSGHEQTKLLILCNILRSQEAEKESNKCEWWEKNYKLLQY